MPKITLTNTPQEIPSSSSGAFVKSDKPVSFMVGFGQTSPSDGFENTEPINYAGGLGSIWVWATSMSYPTTLYYSVAV